MHAIHFVQISARHQACPPLPICLMPQTKPSQTKPNPKDTVGRISDADAEAKA